MPQNNIIRWKDGRGWIVLSGGDDTGSVVRASAIGRSTAGGVTAYLTFGSDSADAEKILDDMEDLGASSGYLVDVLTEDDETIRERLSEAMLIVLQTATDPDDVRSGLIGAAMDGIEAAYANGAVILAEGTTAALFGTWFLLSDNQVGGGLDWLEHILVVPGINAIADSPMAHSFLRSQPDAVAIVVGKGAALALGPDGEIEKWGNGQVTVALGSGYHP